MSGWQTEQALRCSCRGSDEYCPCQNVREGEVAEARRETAARAIYDKRPFYHAESTSPMERSITVSQKFDWDSAPAFYREECFELGDAVLAALDGKAALAKVLGK